MILMKNKIYYFTFFDNFTQRSETIEVNAKTFEEALPGARIFRNSLNQQHSKCNWQIVSTKNKEFFENI